MDNLLNTPPVPEEDIEEELEHSPEALNDL